MAVSVRRPAVVALAAVTAGLPLLAGCAADQGAPSDFCKAVSSLDSAVTEINQDPLTKSTISAVEASLASVDNAVANLVDTAEQQFQDAVTAVEDATKELDRAVASTVEQPTPANLEQSRTALADVTSAVDELAQSTSSSC